MTSRRCGRLTTTGRERRVRPGMTRAARWTRLAPVTPDETESAGEEQMTTSNGRQAAHGTTEAARAALDVMLTDATTPGRTRFVSPGAAVSVAAGLARRPDRAARRAAGFGRELTRVARGSSELRPARRDRRFADPAWETSWLYRRVLQSHLALGDAVDGLISDAGLDWHREREARFIAGNVVDALAPSNFPWSNPAVVKETVDQGGLNLVRGARRFAGDFPHLPSTVDTSRFAVGDNLAAHARVRRPAHRRLRAHPVRAADAERSARSRSCSPRRRSTSSTCSTSRRSAAWSSGSCARASRCSSCPGATPRPSRATSTSTRTRPRSSRRATPSRRSPGSPPCTSTAPARAGSSPRARSAISRPRGAPTGSRA